MGVYALPATILPGTCIRLQGKASCLTAERLEASEQVGIAHARQPFVDEHLRSAENHAAVCVVLELLGRLVADAHRTATPKPRKIGRYALLEGLVGDDAVHGA